MRSELDSIIETLFWTEPSIQGAEISPELVKQLEEEWEEFTEQTVEKQGFDPFEHRIGPINRAGGNDESNYAAQDWVLTRNSHGCGFWGSGWENPYARILTEACYGQGRLDVYVGDDGKVYSA